ncbi:hypothetical protein vBYenM636_04 [Yersinia phage vB_YenM_636]|nr:hypothetical protein vBYenM12_04 [Yersinia phage vB_YenM_12]QKN86346.1 hypothetical protein vBYenM22_04 [Yersinia phage vB_YenM_22]QKN86437.1 hypothetical protein vBYenM25_04 [Yersinia phage vB_YenM_25]QKN86528.1 hypothetical protein vBYenM27_04 [Yersinia phage vB_YenM_27]QKN86619.1 hypothetical protein vBYenM39_04 [Yersinia phage vB_YenM_39]QKN86710.1 hypothetical protein vBYenM126_04 [Yersinia phage vB_YenM_126]QKN86801.1 hypothetical protein vBYenM526-1_04 [Yersinia phage vB_YenM_526-1]
MTEQAKEMIMCVECSSGTHPLTPDVYYEIEAVSQYNPDTIKLYDDNGKEFWVSKTKGLYHKFQVQSVDENGQATLF